MTSDHLDRAEEARERNEGLKYDEYHERGEAMHTEERLEYLRGELRAERISYGELAELQGLVEHIDAGDVELLEAAGVPEFPDEA